MSSQSNQTEIPNIPTKLHIFGSGGIYTIFDISNEESRFYITNQNDMRMETINYDLLVSLFMIQGVG